MSSPINMSNAQSGILSSYNSLLDKNLSGYFSNTKMRKHLAKSGLIDKTGRITSNNAYRMKMAKKEHRDNVRDLLASAIVDKALDMERMRRYEIRKRLEELYKIELVQKVRSERGKRVNDDLVALLTPRKKSGKRKAKSAAVTKTEKKDTKLPNIHFTEKPKKLFYEDVPESTNGNNIGSFPSQSQPPQSSDKKKLHPHPPPGRSKKKKRNVHRGLMLAKSDQMIAHRVQLQSMAEVTMKYLGSPLNLTNDIFPSSKLSEIQIVQQHCGASTITVFRELLPANTLFTFVSRRHRGSPFGLTIYINGIQNIRISSCCEYKHKPGHKVGGKNSQFGLVAVQGAAPCYRCQIRLNLVDGNKTVENEEEASSSDEESAVKSYDIIVSRAGRHSDSKLERPVSASVMTQTRDAEDNQNKDNIVETDDYQDEEFEEDVQFATNQEKLSSDNERSSSLSSSSSESETESESEEVKEVEEENSISSKTSDSDKAEDNSDKQDEEDKAEEETKHDSGTSSDSDEDTASVASEKSIEKDVSSEIEKSSEIEESSDGESESNKEEANEQHVDKDTADHITIQKDESSDDDESTLSASSRSSHSGSDKEDVKEKQDSEDSTASVKDDHDNDQSSETDAVVSDKGSNSDASDKDKDSDTEVANTSDESDNEIPHDDEEEKQKTKENKDVEVEKSEKKDDEVEVEKLDLRNEDDDDNDEQLGIQNGDEDDESEVDEGRATSVISRESTMLTGNEDGNFDSVNKTIQFNEEVDVVTYAKIEGTSTEEETPRSDDSEGEYEITGSANVVLTDLGDDGMDDYEDVADFEKKTVDEKTNPDEGEADGDDKPPKRAFREGTVESFVDSWRNVQLENLYLTEDQTNELISLLVEKKDEIVDLSLKNTIVDGGIEVLKDSMKQLTELLELNLGLTDMGPDEVEHLVEIILDGTQQIETLIIHDNPIDDEGTSILAVAIARLRHLRKLDLSHCRVGDDGADSLFDYLSENTTLKELRLSRNELTNEGWRYISSALKVNDTLVSLYVDSNNMGDDGVQILCNGLVKSKSIECVDLRDNSLKDEGGDALYQAIVKCTALYDVASSNNLFSEEMEKNLSKLMDMKVS